ncbi:MAG TPA: sigma-70 family RNA polymerase sigma factor [Rhodoglobus sp.]|nr:sigma-70 family RNA polymerase sigma factor [Rhodoglobus sp.]
MNRPEPSKPTTSDEVLVERTRAGDRRAYAELWRRHFRSGARVARQFTSSIDADDLVSEAYTRIYQRVLAGGGPNGAFRPYLYTTIRNLASSWGASAKDVQVDDMTVFEDPATTDDPAAIALDRSLTAKAFRSLPERWQTVLWYTEVEGMDPHEVAPMLGMTANGVAALSYRAREGLRKAWLQAHVDDASASGECRWAISKIGDHARRSLSARDTERMDFHLATCAKCAIISEEVDEVGSRLAFVMLPILLGGVAGGTLLASLETASSAMAASGDAIPAMPEAIGAGGAAAAGAFGLLGAATAPVALVGSIAIVVGVSGSVVALTGRDAPVDAPTSVVAEEQGPSVDGADVLDDPIVPTATDGTGTPAPDDPANIPSVGGSGSGSGGGSVGGDVGDLVGGVVDTITGGAPPEDHTAPGGVVGTDIALDLSGSGTPGAHLSLQAAGQIYATTTIAADGTFALHVTGVPGGLASLELVQTVDETYLLRSLGLDWLVGGLTHLIDDAVGHLIRPLGLSGNDSGVDIVLLG